MRLVAKLALAVAAVAVAAAVVTAVSAQPRPEGEKPAPHDERFEVKVTPEMIRHTRIDNTLYFVSAAWSAAALLLLLFSGASRRMRDAAARVTKKPFVMSMLYVAMLTVATALLQFPLNWYGGYAVPHQFDLSDQSLLSWLGDEAKGLAVATVVGAIVGALALWAIGRFRRWWVVLWMGSIPLILFLVVVQPVVLDPIFNKFQPLRDRVLARKLLDLASRAGIENSRVYEVDKSKQTKTMNAYVNGIGPTARIVMWDTLLAKLTEDEVLAVMGHEMGHYVMKHLWKGLAFAFAVSTLVLFLAQQLHDGGVSRFGPRWGARGPGDPAALPWLLFVAGVISFLLSPVFSGYSRMIEHDADVFALELTHLNEPAASAFVKLAEDSKRDPNPSPFIKFWLYTHPPVNERIQFALNYRPWERGEPNRFWKP